MLHDGVPVLGNFDSASGKKPREESQAFACWSGWKRSLFLNRGGLFLAYFSLLASSAVFLLIACRSLLPPGALAGGVVLAGMALTELLIAALADAIDIPRRYLIFYAASDLLLLILVYFALELSTRIAFKGRARTRVPAPPHGGPDPLRTAGPGAHSSARYCGMRRKYPHALADNPR